MAQFFFCVQIKENREGVHSDLPICIKEGENKKKLKYILTLVYIYDIYNI